MIVVKDRGWVRCQGESLSEGFGLGLSIALVRVRVMC